MATVRVDEKIELGMKRKDFSSKEKWVRYVLKILKSVNISNKNKWKKKEEKKSQVRNKITSIV